MTAFIRRAAFPLLAGALLLAACDDPLTIVPEHPEAHGLVVTADGVELLRWTEDDADPPAVTFDAGATYDVVITLLGEDGLPLEHEHEGEDEEETVRVTIGNTAIATWTPEGEPEGHEHEHVEVHGELAALTAGTTQMLVELMHGDHADWEVLVTLTVQ